MTMARDILKIYTDRGDGKLLTQDNSYILQQSNAFLKVENPPFHDIQITEYK